MLTQSKETRDAWRASQRTLDIKVTIDGKTYGATDINSLKYDSGAYNGDTFAIGSTYSNTVQIEFSHLIEGLKLGMEVRPSIGIKTSSGYVYEPLGVFIISSEIKMDRNNNLTTVSASDRFCGLEGTYVSKLTYPAKVLDVIAEICAQSGVKANTDDLARLPHQADLPAPITGQSYRKALGWIAQLYIGYALFDRQGLFTIRTISEPNYELDPSQYEQAGLTKNEAAYKINGIQCQVTLTTKTRDGESTEETKTYQAGDATGSQIKLENNIMTPQRLNDIWEQLKDLTFYPFSLNWFGNPAVEAGDWLRLEDKQRNSFVVPNSSYTLDFNGGLSATSKADQTTSSDQMVPWQGSVAQTIKELQLRRLPDGTVVFPPSVTAPPTNAKFNDVWFKKNGNSTELWIFEKQDDGSGKWIRKDLSDDEIKKKVADAQQGLNQAKADIISNKQKADADIENLNKSIEANKKAADQDIQNLNKSIEANKKTAAESLQKLNDSVANLQGQYDNNIVPDLNKAAADAADALQKYVEAQNSITDLTKQAQQQGKDIADVTSTVNGLNINYANLAGDVSSTKADVKGLQTTIGTANGDIAQLKLDAQNLQTMLAGKVDDSVYQNFVTLTNQALAAKLTASDLAGYAKTVDVQATANGLQLNIDSVNGRLDNLKIGGRNLVLGTDNDIVIDDTGNTGTQGWHFTTINLTQQPKVGDQITVSAEATLTGQGDLSTYDVILYNQAVGSARSNSKRLSSGKRASATLQVNNLDGNGNTVLLIYAGKIADTQGKKNIIHHLKVEMGNTPTAWTPAPEDFTNNITQLSARITANSQQFSSYYTKSETDSKADAAKNDAVSTIKGDANWTGLTNIITNSGFLQSADGFVQKVQQTTLPMLNGGGVNLVKGTSNDWQTLTGSGWFQQTTSNYWYSTGYDKTGDQITYSIRIKNTSSYPVCAEIVGYNSDQSTRVTAARSSVVQPSAEQSVSVTLTISSSTWWVGGWVVTQDSSTPQFSIQVKSEKLERGSVATPWTPNSAELATQVAFTELTQTVNGLQTTVSGNYGDLQTQISQTAGAIRGDLSDQISGVQNQITTTASGLTAQIDNIRVGGRNLLHGTSDQYKTLTYQQQYYATTALDMWTSTEYYHAGDQFTYSATITNVSNVPVRLVLYCYNSDKKTVLKKAAGPTVGSNSGSVPTSVSITIDSSTWFICSDIETLDGQASSFSIQVKDEQLEKGTVPTQWTANPDDVASQFVEINATINGLQSTVSGNYGALQTQISQTAATIRSELSDQITGVTNQITTTASGLNARISAIQIGGRNLLHNTSNQYRTLTGAGWLYQTTASDMWTSTAEYHNGDQFTYSAKIFNNSNVPVRLALYCYGANKQVRLQKVVGPTVESGKTAVTSVSITMDGQTWFLCSDIETLDGEASTFSIQVKDEQLEEGNVRTAWTTNPDDIASQFTEVNATINGLQSTVGSNYSALQSQINQTATTIRGEVTNSVSGLQTQITQQADNFNVSLNSLRKETAWQKVTTAIDANNYKTTGNYWIQAAPNSNTPDSSAWAYLQVVAYPDVKRIKQTWQRDNNENEIYTRLLIGDNWTSWQRTVTGGNIMAQINMSAGTTLIQNDKIYMDASSTIFSGNAFIPSAAITSLTADKITAGTINGAKVNVINLNANNITAGTLRGSNGEFYLDSGALHVWQNNHDAWIDQNGIHDYDNQGNNVWISRGSISAYGNSSGAYLFDGGLYLHKSQSLSDAVLNPNYGSITKSDNIVSFGTSGLDIDGKDGFLLRTHGWNDQTLAYLNGNEIIGAGIAGKSDGFMNIAAKKQLFLYAGEPVQNDKLKTIPKLVLDGTYQNGQTALKGTFSQYFFQGPSSGFSGGITLQDEFVNVGSLNGKNYFSISSDGAISITANGKSILSLNGLFPGVNGDFNVSGNFTVTGSKNAIVPTSRGMAAINAYETAEYYFGDIGETQTNSNGVVTVMIDPYFLETVNTLVPYQVFLTPYGNGNVWVSSRSANNFTVKSSNPNIHFAWEIKAKRKGYENDRMKIVKGVFNNEQY